MTNRSRGAIISVAVLVGMSCGCGGARESSAKLPVRLVMSSQVYAQMPVILAPALGYYDDESLDVQIENIQSNTKAVHALVGGSADVSTGSLGQVLSVASEGHDVKAFTTILLGSQAVLVVGPDSATKVRSVQDLRGAIVGVAAYGGPSQQTANWILSRHGLSPSDVTIVPIGTMATAVAAVEHSKVAAAFMNEVEYLMLQKRGVNVHLLVDLRGRENTKRIYGMEEYPTTVLMAKERWLREHSETARRLARAINRTMQWMHQQSPATVLDKIPARYRGDRDIDLAAVSTVLPMFSKTGITPAEGVEAVKRVLSISVESLRTGSLDLSKTYTNEFVAGR